MSDRKTKEFVPGLVIGGAGLCTCDVDETWREIFFKSVSEGGHQFRK